MPVKILLARASRYVIFGFSFVPMSCEQRREQQQHNCSETNLWNRMTKICKIHDPRITPPQLREGEVILKTSPLDSFGGPKPALNWCVNKANSLGFTIPQGGVLLAGTNGAAMEADRGHYEVSYGPLGTIEFTIA